MPYYVRRFKRDSSINFSNMQLLPDKKLLFVASSTREVTSLSDFVNEERKYNGNEICNMRPGYHSIVYECVSNNGLHIIENIYHLSNKGDVTPLPKIDNKISQEELTNIYEMYIGTQSTNLNHKRYFLMSLKDVIYEDQPPATSDQFMVLKELLGPLSILSIDRENIIKTFSAVINLIESNPTLKNLPLLQDFIDYPKVDNFRQNYTYCEDSGVPREDGSTIVEANEWKPIAGCLREDEVSRIGIYGLPFILETKSLLNDPKWDIKGFRLFGSNKTPEGINELRNLFLKVNSNSDESVIFLLKKAKDILTKHKDKYFQDTDVKQLYSTLLNKIAMIEDPKKYQSGVIEILKNDSTNFFSVLPREIANEVKNYAPTKPK